MNDYNRGYQQALDDVRERLTREREHTEAFDGMQAEGRLSGLRYALWLVDYLKQRRLVA